MYLRGVLLSDAWSLLHTALVQIGFPLWGGRFAPWHFRVQSALPIDAENRWEQDPSGSTQTYHGLSTIINKSEMSRSWYHQLKNYVCICLYIYIYVRIVHDNIQQSSIFSAMVWPLGQFALRSCQQAKSTVSSTVTGDVKPWKNYGRTARTKLQKHLSKSSVSQRLLVLVVQFSRF